MMKRKPDLLHIFVGIDVVLLLAAIFLFGSIFVSVTSVKNQETIASAPPQVTDALLQETATPSPSQAPTPSPSQTPKPLTVYETEQFRFYYDSQQLTLSDRSEDVGNTAVALTFGSLEIPRVDIQVLDGASLGISQEDFLILAQAAANSYFAGSFVESAVLDMVMEDTVYTAELQVVATDVSPALNVYVRLIPGTNYGVLAVYLTPESTAQEEVSYIRETLQSVSLNSA